MIFAKWVQYYTRETKRGRSGGLLRWFSWSGRTGSQRAHYGICASKVVTKTKTIRDRTKELLDAL